MRLLKWLAPGPPVEESADINFEQTAHLLNRQEFLLAYRVFKVVHVPNLST
jgi:hypothetical protein